MMGTVCCTANVAVWPVATDRVFMADGRFGCEAAMAGPAAGSIRSLVRKRRSSARTTGHFAL